MALNPEDDMDGSKVPGNVPIREDLVNTAVKFLSNSGVQGSPLANRESFLRKKGLTEQEISTAFQRASVVQAAQAQQHHGLPQHTAISMPYSQGYLLPPQSGWSRFKELANSVAIIGGIVYGLYLLYKKYIAPFLFGTSKKRSPIEESIASLDESVKQSVQGLREDLQKVQTDIDKINEQQIVIERVATSKQVSDVKSEITSLKGLLLNRKQFPMTIEAPTSSEAHIPSWQLTDDGDAEKALDSHEGSSSHSSTTDVATTNGSDSSVELIGD